MPSKLSKAVPPFFRVVPQFGHRQGKGAPRAPFSTRLAPVPFYTPLANSCKGCPHAPRSPRNGKGTPAFPPPPLFPSQRGKLRVHWDGAPLRRNVSCALAKGDGAALRRDASRAFFPLSKGNLPIPQETARPCAETPRPFPAKKGKLSLPFSFAPALQLARQLPQPVHRVQPLPGQAGILAAEMAVVGGGPVDGALEVQLLDDGRRP